MDANGLLEIMRYGENEQTEFKRSITADIGDDIVAFANAYGGHILIGIENDGRIVGCDLEKAMDRFTNAAQSIIPPPSLSTSVVRIGDAEILAIKVEKSDALCSIGGLAYVRIGAGKRPLSIQEIIMLSAELGTIDWDSAPLTSLGNMKKEYVNWYFATLKEKRGKTIAAKDRIRYLRSIGAIRNRMLTNAGALFFTDVQETMPSGGVRVIHLEGEEAIHSKEYEGPIWRIVEDALADLSREMMGRDVIVGARRVNVGGFPMAILREALVNAVAHRNYAVHADVRVMVSKNRIEIINSGGLLPGVDLQDAVHVPRNPTLCDLLHDVGLIEKYGRGISLMREEAGKHKDLVLKFNPRPSRFSVEIERAIDSLLDETDRRILDGFMVPGPLAPLLDALGLSRPTIVKRINRLIALGLLTRRGGGRSTIYATLRG
jgi:ATP-dependent DNA helicase RecG